MTVIYTQDDYKAEVRLLDVRRDCDKSGETYLLEVVKNISPGWFGCYPEGIRFTAWRSNSLPSNWRLSNNSSNSQGGQNERSKPKHKHRAIGTKIIM